MITLYTSLLEAFGPVGLPLVGLLFLSTFLFFWEELKTGPYS